MSEKSEQKRNYIVAAARKVFVEKGFRSVTMQDIVEACGISRGGLYLYFNSTGEIFSEVLKQEDGPDGGAGRDGHSEQEERNERESWETDNSAAEIPPDAAASDILAIFFKEQKKEILRKKNSLTVAIYEYYFQNKIPKKENLLKHQFDAGVLILENLIRDGIRAGEFYCEDPRGTASNIMYMLEGLKVTARTIGVSEAAIDKELFYIMQSLVFE